MGLFSGLAAGWEKAKQREKGVRKSIRKSARKSLRRSTVKEVQATTTQVATAAAKGLTIDEQLTAAKGPTIDEQLTAAATSPGDIELGGVADKGKGSDEEVVRHTMTLLSDADRELVTSDDFDEAWSDLSWKERRKRLETLGLAKDPAKAPGWEKANASAPAKRSDEGIVQVSAGDIESNGGVATRSDEDVVRDSMMKMSELDKKKVLGAYGSSSNKQWGHMSWSERRRRLEDFGLIKASGAPSEAQKVAKSMSSMSFVKATSEDEDDASCAERLGNAVGGALSCDCFSGGEYDDCCFNLALGSFGTCFAGGLTFGFFMLGWWCYNGGFPEPPMQPAAPPPVPSLGLNAPNAPPGAPFAEVEYEQVWWWWRYPLLWFAEVAAIVCGVTWCYLMLMACNLVDVDDLPD